MLQINRQDPKDSPVPVCAHSCLPTLLFSFRVLGALLAGLAAGGCSLVPSHEIPVHEAYMLAGVQVGDTVEVTTKDGKRHRLVVTGVDATGIAGSGQAIALDDVRKLVKFSWTEPEHPCGAGHPVGCSAPDVMLLMAELSESTTISELPDRLEPSCVAHDYCYRHGFATYGVGREECDQAFFEDMKKVCRGPLYLDVLDFKHFASCMAAIGLIYELVRDLGEEEFLRDESTYCEYDLARDPAPGRIETHVVGGLLEDGPVGPRAESDH